MTDILKEIDDMIERGSAPNVYIGRSVTAHKRFATLSGPTGDTVGKGVGQTAGEALIDALRDMRGEQRIETPELPGIVTRLPGL